MPYRKNLCLKFWLTVQMTVMVLALPNLLEAQDPGQATGNDKPAAQDASKTTNSPDAEPVSPVALAWADSYIREIGRSGLLAGNPEGLRWGSLYIPTATASGVVEDFEATSTSPNTEFTGAILQTTVVYDHRIGNGRIALQYSPSLAIANGEVVKDFSNQNVSVDVLIYQRPRWNVRISDSFRYSYSQESFGFPFLDVSALTLSTATNSFLDGPARWLSNDAYLSIGYAVTARSSIIVTPRYIYSESGVGPNLARGVSYGGSVSWNYRTSERQTFGVEYSGQDIHEAFATPLPATDTIFNTVAGTAGRQMSATWVVTGALGVTSSSPGNGQRDWNFYGAFGTVKQLGHSTIGLNYSRADTLSTGLISSEYADRVDLTYQNKMNQRLSWGVGGGYLREIQSGGTSGWYASANSQFLLAPRAGVFSTFTYSHKNQAVTTLNLFNGNRDIYIFGILWQPSRTNR
jgi:hypothetical protein